MRIFLFITITLFQIPVFSQNDIHESCKDLSHIIALEKKGHAKTFNFQKNELTQNYDLKYHRFLWEVDPASNYIKGAITTYFIPTQDEFSQINFDFADNMTINEIIFHGNSLDYLQSNNNLQVNLNEILAAGQLDSILIKYEGAPSSTGFGSFEQGTHDGTPVLWTLSEPYGARVWWPCKQDLNDKIDSIDIYVKTPMAYRVGSNGKLISEVTIGEHTTYYWKHRYPIAAYLISLAVTNYVSFSDFVAMDNGDSIEILNYVFPEDVISAQNALGSTVEIMELFNDLFGIYPFADEKYGHAQFGWGGGMEHQTMSSMGGFSYGLQAHELAHQWFGDKVTCGSWEDIWLNEGFATYLTGLTDEFLGSPQAWLNWKVARINAITSQPDGSVWVNDTTSVSRIFNGRLSYNKGAYLLHMLRWKIGDEHFFQAVQNYLNDPDLAYGYALTADLQNHLEAQSGIDLTEFFADWFYGQGYPTYHVTWSNLGDKVYIKLQQSTSHNSVDFFEMPIPIKVIGEGQDSLLRLEHYFNGQEFKIDLPFSVDEIQFDPSYWIISANNTSEEVIMTSVSENKLAESIQITPNPTRNNVEIIIEDQALVIHKFVLSNSEGKILLTSVPNGNRTYVEMSPYPAGVYHFIFYTREGLAVKKVMKK